jgi:restriction system protein
MFNLVIKFKDFWPIIKIFLWIFAISLSIEIFKIGVDYLVDWFEQRRIKKWLEKHKTLEEWKKLEGREFEKIVAAIFRNLGYKVKITGGPRDWGIDLIAIKEGKRYFIQCKNIEKVLPSQIREFYGSIVDRLKQEEKGFFVTTGKFTEECKDFAYDKPIGLIDGIKLEKLARGE